MTPTTVKLFSGLFFPTEWPSASPLGKKRFERVSLTRTTLGADRVSASVTSRPRRMGMPRVWQKSGPTWFAPKVVLVNETLSNRFFPKGDALGHSVGKNKPENSFTVVGVIGDSKYKRVDEKSK